MSATTRSTLLSTTALALALATPALAQDLPGRALQFDGFDDIVRVPSTPALDLVSAVTLEAWVRPFAPDGGIAGMWGSGGLEDKFLLELDGGLWTARLAREGVPGHVVIAGPPALLGIWTHVALTYDGTSLALWIDGEVYDRVEAPGKLVSEPIDLRMGIEDVAFGPPPSFFAGQLDEVRLWRDARTSSEMARFRNQTVAPDTDDLVGSWRFDDGVAEQVVRDGSSFGHDGSCGTDAAVGPDDPMRITSDAPMRWEHLGSGLAGSAGVPFLVGDGTLVPATLVGIELRDARPNTSAHLVIGLSTVNAPFKGGTLVPADDLVIFGIPTGPAGSIGLSAAMPALPPAFDMYMQYWVEDPAGPVGFAASNAVWAETP